jgi:hypothetical protein
MKIQITGTRPDKDALEAFLKTRLSGWKSVGRQPGVVMCDKDGTYAAAVLPAGSGLKIVGNYASVGKRFVFMMSFLALGILPALIWYFAARHKGFKATEQELADILLAEYSPTSLPLEAPSDEAQDTPAEAEPTAA